MLYELGLMNFDLPTLLYSQRKICREEDSDEIKGKDNFYVVNEIYLFLTFYDAYYNMLIKYSCI